MTGTVEAAAATRFLDEPEGALFPRMRWLTPRRLAFFLLFWVSIFFAGSLFVNNPFTGSAGASNWDLGAGFPNYYWVVMYLHGLNTGLVGLAALIACDILELPSLRVRRGITGGVLLAGVLSPLGAIVNTTPPWPNVGLWVQVAAFLALDEIVILLLWGMLEVWRAGAPRSRTLPFLLVALVGATMLAAALIGHLAGTILGFGDNPAVLGQYAAQEMNGQLSDFTARLIGSHAYLMISAVPAGIAALVAIRFGYYRLTGWTKRVAQLGLVLLGLDLLFQLQMAFLAAFTDWPGDLPPQISSLPGMPSFLALNDVVNFALLVLGGVLVLAALLLGSRRLAGWRVPLSLPGRLVPIVALGEFVLLTFVTEPTDGSALGPPPLAWLRLFVAFYLTMFLTLAILLSERLLRDGRPMRVGWTALVGSVLMTGGILAYLQLGALWGGYLAVAGIIIVGVSLVTTAWWGLSGDAELPTEPKTRGSTPQGTTPPG